MAINIYQVQSPLSQVTRNHTDAYLKTVGDALGEELKRVELDEFEKSPFGLVFVASGGSEGIFKAGYEHFSEKPCYILTSGESNSLAASMEILSFLQERGKRGEIIHGSVADVARRIRALEKAYRALGRLKGMRMGTIGAPSDWLIASDTDGRAYGEKIGLTLVPVPIEELISEANRGGYEPNEYTEKLMALGYDKEEMRKSFNVYGALKRIIKKYDLNAVTVRCFDLLDTIHTTGCLALAILNAEGIYGGCEGDVPALLSMAVLGAITGEPMFLCNPSRFDTKAGTALFAHCTIPPTMLREFCLNTHFESGIGVAVQGKFEEDDCTIFKCEGDLSRFHAQEGHIIDTPFSDMLCRTQIKVQLDDFSYFLTRPINNHHIICRGRHAADAEAFFRLLQA